MALARGATNKGARIFEETAVTGVSQENGRVTGVYAAPPPPNPTD